MADCSIESFLKHSYPRVIIRANLLEYIQEIVNQCKDEISWVMEVTELGNYDYEIESVFIPQQRVNGATTEFNADDIMHLMSNEPTFQPEKWRGWGHSHVNMATNPSSQDKKQMEEFANDCDFFIGMIHNKRGDMFCWMVDSKRRLFFKNVEVEVVSEYGEEIKQLITERVSKLMPPAPKTTTTTVTQESGLAPVRDFAPFKMSGYDVCFSTKVVNQILQYGYTVEGVFFPSTLYPQPSLAVQAYERLLTEMFKEDKTNTSDKSIEPIPPIHQMEILEELDDYNDVIQKYTGGTY